MTGDDESWDRMRQHQAHDRAVGYVRGRQDCGDQRLSNAEAEDFAGHYSTITDPAPLRREYEAFIDLKEK